MNTVGTPLLWGGFAVVVAIMLAIDLLLQGRRGAHAMTMKQAAAWSLVWVTLSLLFNAAFWWYLVQTEGRAVADPQALAFLTGYLIEKSLAVDNVFVWLMLFSYFSVPYSAAIFLIPICISFDTAEKRRYATYLILNRRFSFEF